MYDYAFQFFIVVIIYVFVFQSESCSLNNPTNITAEEYFNPEVDLQGRDIGRPKEVTKKVQSFKVSSVDWCFIHSNETWDLKLKSPAIALCRQWDIFFLENSQ